MRTHRTMRLSASVLVLDGREAEDDVHLMFLDTGKDLDDDGSTHRDIGSTSRSVTRPSASIPTSCNSGRLALLASGLKVWTQRAVAWPKSAGAEAQGSARHLLPRLPRSWQRHYTARRGAIHSRRASGRQM
jgi:hypothetical protein